MTTSTVITRACILLALIFSVGCVPERPRESTEVLTPADIAPAEDTEN